MCCGRSIRLRTENEAVNLSPKRFLIPAFRKWSGFTQQLPKSMRLWNRYDRSM